MNTSINNFGYHYNATNNTIDVLENAPRIKYKRKGKGLSSLSFLFQRFFDPRYVKVSKAAILLHTKSIKKICPEARKKDIKKHAKNGIEDVLAYINSHAKDFSIHNGPTEATDIWEEPFSKELMKQITGLTKARGSLDPRTETKSHLDQNELMLTEKQWLENHHLNIYFRFLSQMYPSFFFSPIHHLTALFDSSSDLSKACVRDLTASNRPFLAYPLRINDNHWTLVFIDREKGHIEYYDSKASSNKRMAQELEKIAKNVAEQEKKPFLVIPKITTCIQPDGYQCGVLILKFLETRLENPDFDMNDFIHQNPQALISSFRKQVSDKLANMRIVVLQETGIHFRIISL